MAGTERSRMRRLLYRWGRTEGTCALWTEEMERLRADSARRAQRSAESVQSMSEAFSNREAQRMLEALEEDCHQELRFKHCMDDLIRTLEPQDRLLLELRYHKGMSWLKVARQMHYSEDRTKHRDAELMDLLLERVQVSTMQHEPHDRMEAREAEERADPLPAKRKEGEHGKKCGGAAGQSEKAPAAGGALF